MKNYNVDKAFFAGIIVSYSCFFLSTMLKLDFWIGLFSPITAAIIGTTIMTCLKKMGRYWIPSFLLALGIYSYMVADLVNFVGKFVLHTDKLADLVVFIFLLPNYFFGASVAVYFIQKLKGRELYQFLINTFTFTVIGFVAFRKLLIYLGAYDNLKTHILVRIYLYFVINLFILIMIWHMSVMIARETGFKGTNTMIIGITVYIIMDIPYTYVQALGINPENIYTNLVYMACMILMAHGIFHQVHHHHVFRLKGYTYSEKAAKMTRLRVLLGISVSIFLWYIKLIEQNELFYILLALLAYWITTATFQNGALNEQLLKQQDILTGLYNRRYSSIVMEESIRTALDQGKRFGVFCVDLNNFKPINDTYGHDMGDRVLKEFGSRMLALPSYYTSFRTGGDEFMIVRDNVNDDKDLTESADYLQKMFHTPIHLDTYMFQVSGSIGISIFPDNAQESELLILYADAAMYSVKHSGNKDNYKFFDLSLVETVEKHKALETRLKNSDPAKDFVLHFQPRYDAKTGAITAAEVFPRLKGDNTYTAADLLPIAEEVGLMNRLGNWILDTALKQLRQWREKYNKDLSISINLSPLQLLDMDFLDKLKESVMENGLSTDDVHLDISNEVIMGASITAKETLRTLNGYGFKLSLNDFGGDDINLSHILICGFSAIHLSPSLIQRADKEEEANILIRSIIGLAENMSISAYAVGVETKEQADKLKKMGIDALQGYYYGKPTDAGDFEARYLE